MTVTKDIQARLARTLDAANRKEKKPRKVPMSRPKGEAVKISISLFAEDAARIDKIRDGMAGLGHRVSVSQAVRLAVRSLKVSPALVAVLADAARDDGRKGR